MARRPLFASLVLSLSLIVGAGAGGGSPPPPSNGPKTAVEKQRLEAKQDPDLKPPPGKKWGGWRYQGDRENCFFVVGRRCFKTEAEACEAANCGAKKCAKDGGGPATVTCK